MSLTTEKIEKQYRIPCGPMDISADSVCRRSLKDSLDGLLDRLTVEINQTPTKPSPLPKGVEIGPGGSLVGTANETEEDKKERLLREGKLRAEVQLELKKYREELQGNSKMLQDISGKYESI